MNDFNSWEEVKEHLQHAHDPDDWTTVQLTEGRGVQLYWSKDFASCGDDQCCWNDFENVDGAIADIILHSAGHLEWVRKND